MNKEREGAAVRRAANLYRDWTARPWYVKAWDRVCSEAGYILFVVKGK